jgi:ankyrin repeat protein
MFTFFKCSPIEITLKIMNLISDKDYASLARANKEFNHIVNVISDFHLPKAASLLHSAIYYNEVPTIVHLLNSKINPSARVARLGDTALHRAVKCNSYFVAYLLLKHGAKVDMVNDKGQTPLDIAIEKHGKGSRWDLLLTPSFDKEKSLSSLTSKVKALPHTV